MLSTLNKLNNNTSNNNNMFSWLKVECYVEIGGFIFIKCTSYTLQALQNLLLDQTGFKKQKHPFTRFQGHTFLKYGF